jgi:hypothetical protein
MFILSTDIYDEGKETKLRILNLGVCIPLRVLDHVNFRCIYFLMKMVVRPKHVVDNLNKIVNNY